MYTKEYDSNYVLKNWFILNIENPYPSEIIKNQLALESNMSKNQVSNWFKKARIRGLMEKKELLWSMKNK
jgi:hypothetical protein